jgi:hypothetical protein
MAAGGPRELTAQDGICVGILGTRDDNLLER